MLFPFEPRAQMYAIGSSARAGWNEIGGATIAIQPYTVKKSFGNFYR